MHRPSSKSSESRSLTQGSPVVILGTENVLQRVPHLVDKQGTIKEVPVHPATWVKVEFPDGNVATFRPSALKLVYDNTDVSSNTHSGFQKNECSNTVHNFARPPARRPSAGNSYSKSAGLLSAIDPELWAKQDVRVRSGNHMGLTGHIIGAGNGWVQIQTVEGEVAKRAYELELLSGDDFMFKSTNLKRSSKHRSMRHARNNNSNSSDKFKPERSRTKKRKSWSANVGVKSVTLDEGNSESDENTQTSNKFPRIVAPQLSIEEAKRIHRRKYIHKKLLAESSQDVAYWIKLYKHDVTDVAVEHDILKDFNSSHCDICHTEMWPGCSFCWNDTCINSPMRSNKKPRDRSNSQVSVGTESDRADVSNTLVMTDVHEKSSFGIDIKQESNPVNTVVNMSSSSVCPATSEGDNRSSSTSHEVSLDSLQTPATSLNEDEIDEQCVNFATKALLLLRCSGDSDNFASMLDFMDALDDRLMSVDETDVKSKSSGDIPQNANMYDRNQGIAFTTRAEVDRDKSAGLPDLTDEHTSQTIPPLSTEGLELHLSGRALTQMSSTLPARASHAVSFMSGDSDVTVSLGYGMDGVSDEAMRVKQRSDSICTDSEDSDHGMMSLCPFVAPISSTQHDNHDVIPLPASQSNPSPANQSVYSEYSKCSDILMLPVSMTCEEEKSLSESVGKISHDCNDGSDSGLDDTESCQPTPVSTPVLPCLVDHNMRGVHNDE